MSTVALVFSQPSCAQPEAVSPCLQGVENLFERQDRMAHYGPTFCDITWGAGGSTSELTLEIADKMQNMVSRGSLTAWNTWSIAMYCFLAACLRHWIAPIRKTHLCRCVWTP